MSMILGYAVAFCIAFALTRGVVLDDGVPF